MIPSTPSAYRTRSRYPLSGSTLTGRLIAKSCFKRSHAATATDHNSERPSIWTKVRHHEGSIANARGACVPIRQPVNPSTLQRSNRGEALFLVRRHFRQLRREQAFLFFVQRHTCGCDDLRGHENDQVLFGVLLNVRAERPSNERNVA